MFGDLEEVEGGDGGDKDPQIPGADRSIIEVGPKRGSVPATQRAGSNNNSTVDSVLNKLQSMEKEMDLLRQKTDIAEALVVNSAQMRELASSSKRNREEGVETWKGDSRQSPLQMRAAQGKRKTKISLLGCLEVLTRRKVGRVGAKTHRLLKLTSPS